jgi:O-antigen/teichoic acid export membrane protein
MIKKALSSQLRINMVSGVATTVLNTAVLVVAYPIYLHFLGYEKYGVWLVLATVLTFTQLGDLGLGQAVMKLVAEEYGRGDIKAVQQYVTTALALLCLSGIAALVIILILKTQIVTAFKLGTEEARLVLWLLPYIGILCIYVFMVQALNATLSGLGRMDLVNWAQSGGQVAAVTTACSLLYSGRGIESLLIGNTLSNMLVHLISLICIRRTARIRFLRMDNLDAQRCKRLLRFGGGIFGGSLISMLLSPFNKLMLSRYVGVSAITIYEIAFTGSMQIRALFEVGLRALMPEVSRLSGDMTKYAKDKITEIYQTSMKLIFVFGLPIYGVLGVFAPFLLRVWLGSGCAEMLPGAFRIMMFATFFTLVGVPAYYTIIGLGKIRYFLTASVISVGGNFVLVTTYYALTRHLSVFSIGLCLVISFAVSTAYLICKIHH